VDAKDSGEEEADDAPEKPKKALPAKVEEALARARDAAKADHARTSGRWLALIPLGIGALLLALMMPRATRPDGIPLPRVDERVTSAIIKAENVLADDAEGTRLPGDILSVGSAIRDLNGSEGEDDPVKATNARMMVERLVADALGRKGGDQDLIKLRALQTRAFVNALSAWERGEEPKDFIAVGGGFVRRAEQVGWTQDHKVLLDETQRRVAYKTMWNALTHLDQAAPFQLTLDEERALYAFYIQHPRPPENARTIVKGSLAAASTPEECARARTELRRHEETWRADKIKRLGAIDPTYPTDYALGVVYFRGGRGDLAVDAFGSYLDAHPDGAYAIRARNHQKAALMGLEP